MKFKDIAYKNFKSNLKKYTAYLLCSSFAIMMFFIYSTLLFNKNIMDNTDKNAASMVFSISLIAIALFSIIFINYAHTAFIKSRYKEFGLYLTLGMTKRDVRKIILMENGLIMLFSSIAGIGAGVIFSRLFQMIVAKVLDLKSIAYFLNFKSFALTLAVFITIFAIVIMFSIIATRKLEISELLKESRKSGKNNTLSQFPGILGIILLLSSLIMVFFIARDNELKSNIYMIGLFSLTGFTGIYLIISSLGALIHKLMKKNSSLYYSNMLVVTETNYKFKQNKKVLFILSILSAMIVFCMASPFSLYSLSRSISETNQSNHIEYVKISGINDISTEKLNKIIKGGHTAVENQKSFEFIQLPVKSSDKYDLLQKKPVVSVSSYNTYFKTNLIVPKGQTINVIIAWEPGYHGISPSSKLKFKIGNNSYEFVVKDSLHADHLKWVTGSDVYPTSSGLILNDSDYLDIKNNLSPENIGTIQSVQFIDWTKTGDVVNNLQDAFKNSNSKIKSISKNTISLFKVASTIHTYNTLKQAYSLFIFVMSFLGLLFFISAGSVLYFKQYTEINADKEKFFKLFKIGITEADVKNVISKELKLTFFTPLVLGSIMGYAFLYLVTHMVGGEGIMKEFMMNATKVVTAYFIFQMVFYMMTKRKYISELISFTR